MKITEINIYKTRLLSIFTIGEPIVQKWLEGYKKKLGGAYRRFKQVIIFISLI